MTIMKDSDTRRYECMKHRIYMDEANAECRDPDLYCKFRPSCMIYFMEKEKGRERSKRVG
jgi:hypothetical protein